MILNIVSLQALEYRKKGKAAESVSAITEGFYI